LSIAARGHTRRTLRVLMWPELNTTGPGSLAVASRWERLRRQHALLQWDTKGWCMPDATSLHAGPVLLLLHDTFATPSSFAPWIGHRDFSPVLDRYHGRCLAFEHPTLSVGLEENLQWLIANLAGIPGPFDVVAHGRGALLARALAVDGKLPLRRVCQIGAPNLGTALANEAHLPRFLDAHVAMLARAPKAVALGTLEGALCLSRCVAQGLRASLPGIEVLTPESAPLRALVDFRAPDLQWFTVGARFEPLDGQGRDPLDTHPLVMPNDGVVPEEGCHDPGIPVNGRLQLAGHGTHHHNYFSSERVRLALDEWLG